MRRIALLACFFGACTSPDANGVLEADRSDGLSAAVHLSSSTCTIASRDGRLLVQAELPLPGGRTAKLEIDDATGAIYAEPGFEAHGAIGYVRIVDSAAQMGRFDLTFTQGAQSRRLSGSFVATEKADTDDDLLSDDDDI